MENAKPKPNFKGAGEFDPINSTYKHQIYLINGKILTGYSKSKYYAEKQDKIVLLEDIVLRLYNKGYLQPDKTKEIVFYSIDTLTRQSEEVITLTPKDYSFGSNPKFTLNERLCQFFKRFYIQLNERKFITKDIKHRPITQHEQQIFDLTRKRFATIEQLHEFVLKQFQNGYPQGLVMGFYDQYRSKWLSNSY